LDAVIENPPQPDDQWVPTRAAKTGKPANRLKPYQYLQAKHRKEQLIRRMICAHRIRANHSRRSRARPGDALCIGRLDRLSTPRTGVAYTKLVQAISPKVAQTMAGHSDINLTMNVYGHVKMEEQEAAIAVLPVPGNQWNLGKTSEQRHAKIAFTGVAVCTQVCTNSRLYGAFGVIVGH
jgi:hypothetical protein